MCSIAKKKKSFINCLIFQFLVKFAFLVKNNVGFEISIQICMRGTWGFILLALFPKGVKGSCLFTWCYTRGVVCIGPSSPIAGVSAI